MPDKVALKSPREFKLIGTPARRLDAPAKINGTAVYGIDARPSGLKIATLAQSPAFGGRVKSVDDRATRAVKGVRQIVRLDDAVAVVADHMGAARKGLGALKIEWDDGPHATLATADIAGELEKATLGSGAVAQSVGDVDKAMASTATRIEATYQVPFLAHATMEPMSCTVHVRPDSCEVWIGTQAIARVQAAAASVTGLPLDKIVVQNHLIGGGFGRRLESDGTSRAVEIAEQVDGPVKVVWTHEEDIQRNMYRPYWFDRLARASTAEGSQFPGSIGTQGLRSSRDGCLQHSKMGSILTVPKAQSTWSMSCRTCTSNLCGRSRRAFRPLSGEAWAVAQCPRHRKVHGRAGPGGETRCSCLPARPP